jgi:osmotically inducible protein OsmC
MKRIANAVWKGTGLEGTGTLTTKSGAFKNHPYSFRTRFQNDEGTLGTNPEELVAAAHAGCFNMALSFQLTGAGFAPEELATEAVLEMENEGVHYHIARITLKLKGKVPGITQEQFVALANNAKQTCPISLALSSVEIILDAQLV